MQSAVTARDTSSVQLACVLLCAPLSQACCMSCPACLTGCFVSRSTSQTPMSDTWCAPPAAQAQGVSAAAHNALYYSCSSWRAEKCLNFRSQDELRSTRSEYQVMPMYARSMHMRLVSVVLADADDGYQQGGFQRSEGSAQSPAQQYKNAHPLLRVSVSVS